MKHIIIIRSLKVGPAYQNITPKHINMKNIHVLIVQFLKKVTMFATIRYAPNKTHG